MYVLNLLNSRNPFFRIMTIGKVKKYVSSFLEKKEITKLDRKLMKGVFKKHTVKGLFSFRDWKEQLLSRENYNIDGDGSEGEDSFKSD